ncbi:SAR2788 family putative toxin [Exiguobacterium profundum]|uniref:SAR2788 family putative toxin n=1 Tax=Exiguobacterium TaxID=33986 RepID=UPI000939DB23|nr:MULTISPECIES: SAR2788 family putative toxin [Exiguobacterium]MCT4797239.1 SAR2788 family putative toxin [Exiguobacterium profundum]MCV9898662.1 SAR2788 family putative toxin [Exiguobacterium sp. N5]MDT0190968.1 SAR2788 family putative toxin [Exiguobacterium sp. BG5(2022)]QPI66932.1 hypothetical protein IR194_10705 [Exiguobacterium sp. PBE]
MRSLITKLIVITLIFSSVISGSNVSASDSKKSEINIIEEKVQEIQSNPSSTEDIDVQEELGLNDENLDMKLLTSGSQDVLVNSNIEIDNQSIESNIIFNEEDLEIKATISSNDTENSIKEVYTVEINRIEGENFEGEIRSLNSGETFSVNTIEASASVLPALIPLILRAGLQYVIKHYGKKVAMQAMIDLGVSQITKAYGGVVKDAKNGKGKVITIPNKKQEIVIRLMEAGSGGRKEAYWRMSVGNKALNRAGNFSNNASETHITLQESSPSTIISLIKKFKK